MPESLKSLRKRVNEAVAPRNAIVETVTDRTTYHQEEYVKIQVRLPEGSAVIGYYNLSGNYDITTLAALCQQAEGEGCTNTLYIPEDSKIPGRAFMGSMYENVMIPDGFTEISKESFSHCRNLKNVSIPISVTEIADNAFLNCESLESVVIPANVASVCQGAFSRCRSLKSVTLCNKDTRIGSDAFSGCLNITEVNLPKELGWDKMKEEFKDSPWGMNAPEDVLAKKAEKEELAEKLAKREILSNMRQMSIEMMARSIVADYKSEVILENKTLMIKAELPNGTFVGGVFSINKRKGHEQIDWVALKAVLKQAEDCTQPGTFFATGNMLVECKDIADEFKIKHVVDPDGLIINALCSTKFPDGISKISNGPDSIEFTIEKIGHTIRLTGTNRYSCPDIVIPDGVTEIGEGAFRDMIYISSVTIPDSVTRIEDAAFSCCSGLKTVKMSNNVTYIGGAAFGNCNSLKEITLPQRVKTVGILAFGHCKSLQRVTILSPDIELLWRKDVRFGWLYVFRACGLLREVYLPKGLAWKKIKNQFFQSPLVIPINLEDLNRKPPVANMPLHEMKLADAVKDAFYPHAPYIECEGNNMIVFVRLPNGNAVLGLDEVEDESKAAAKIDWKLVKELKQKAEEDSNGGTLYIFGGKLVKNYRELTFLGAEETYCAPTVCYYHKVVFAKGEYISNDFFKDTFWWLSEIIFDENATLKGKWVFGGRGDIIWKNHEISILKNIVLPKTLTEIQDDAFCYCESLPSIDIPKSVSVIGDRAFCGCTKLKSLALPDGVKEIGAGAFKGCTFKSFTLPDKVTKIGSQAFGECSSLKSINLPDKITEIESSVFVSCEMLKDIVLPDSVTKIGKYAFKGCKMLENLNIPDGVTEIGEGAFSQCKRLKELVLPESITKIGSEAFAECDSIMHVSIPMGIKRLDSNVFQNCKSLESVSITNPDITWQTTPFDKCTAISDVTLPPGFRIKSANKLFKGSSWKAE